MHKKTILDEFEDNTPLSIIWISCLERPRFLKDVALIWKYKGVVIMYKKDYIGWLLNNNFVKRVNRRYFSILDGWFDNLESSLDFVKLIKKDKDTWKLILESEDVRSTFFKSTALFKLLEEDSSIAKKTWSIIPIIVIRLMILLDFFKDYIKKLRIEKKTNDLTILLYSFFGSILGITQLDTEKYINEIGIDRLLSLVDKISKTIQSTEFYGNEINRLMKFKPFIDYVAKFNPR